MSLLRNLRYILRHPLNRGRKLMAIIDYFKWQVISRVARGPIVVNFIPPASLTVKSGMTGATGNIYCGLHEFEEMSFILHFLREGDLFVDVGANVGSYTVLASGVCQASVISFEPIPTTYEYLVRNLEVNNLHELVDAQNKGVGDVPGVLTFTTDMDSTNHVVSKANHAEGKKITIETVTLDDALAEKEPVCIKIDVEGYETMVIEGAMDVLGKESLLAVIMELNGSGLRYDFNEKELNNTMLKMGFKTYKYLPFAREIKPLNDQISTQNNTLYLRNIDEIVNRIETGHKFNVKGKWI